MELFITEIHNEPEVPATIRPVVEDYDVHGEGMAIGFCEICWSQDKLAYLVIMHPAKGEHTMAHSGCIERAEGCEEWEYCTCH